MTVAEDNVARIVQVFSHWDPNGTGKLPTALVKQVLTRLGQPEEEVALLLRQFPNSGEDEMEYKAFLSWLLDDGAGLAKLSDSPKHRVEAVFQFWDTTRTGKIPKDSLLKVLRSLGGDSAQDDVDRLFADAVSHVWIKGDDVEYSEWLTWMFQEEAQQVAQTSAGKDYFAKPTRALFFVDRVLDPESPEPRYATIDAFREKHAGDTTVLRQFDNRVIVCPNCSKPNAYTMKFCNACTTSLEGIPESKNDNIFMGFIYGVGQGKFPLSISIRRESPELLAFDDPLAVSIVHMCIIPTNLYCPDFRFLFTDPARGLKLVDDLMEFGRQACLENYWSSPEFRQRYWNGEDPPQTLEELQELIVLGFNFPPSMYQLHLQFIHGPLFPFHENQALKYKHFEHGRFLPFEYVRAALACGEKAKLAADADTPMQTMIEHISKLGLDYDAAHERMMEKSRRFAKRYDVWRKEDFELTVRTNGEVVSNSTGAVVEGVDVKKQQDQDAKDMKNCGRPTLSMYKYPKNPSEVPHFCDLA